MADLRFAITLALLWLPIAFGCFQDPAPNSSGANETGGDQACPAGTAGCDCYGNGTCNEGLECTADLCKLPECVAGSLNCDCYDGLCLTGLLCTGGVCKPEDPMMGCSSIADCDDDLCTQGDAVCADQCIAGVDVQCPIGASCETGSGSCQCEPGSKVCGNACIPSTQCCTDDDCGGSTCEGGFCTCDGGLLCDGACSIGATCCPGEVTIVGCTCGAYRTCSSEGIWSECAGGNPNKQCEVGQAEPCGNCGTRTCNARCEWTTCQGQGPCMPGQESCTNLCQPLECQPGCFWLFMDGKCC